MVPPWSRDTSDWRPHCLARDMDGMWQGAGMEKQESRQMQSEHPASGMSRVYQSRFINEQFIATVWPDTLKTWPNVIVKLNVFAHLPGDSPVNNIIYRQLLVYVIRSALASGNWKMWSFCSDLRDMCFQQESSQASALRRPHDRAQIQANVRSSVLDSVAGYSLHTEWCMCRVWR